MIDGAWRPPHEYWSEEARTGHLLRRYDADGERYDVAVSLPEAAPAGPLPLLLLTDGSLHFDAAAATAHALARRPAKTGVGPMIVAGIASGAGWSHDARRRDRDLVPDGPGADDFLTLVRDHLLPDIAALAPFDRSAGAVLGHSLGGLFALHALSVFPTAIAISPSLWRLPDLPDRLARRDDVTAARILLVSGGREGERIVTAMPDAEVALAKAATVRRIELADEDHGAIPFAALPAALRFLHEGRPA